MFAQAGVLSPPKPDLGEPNLEEALAWSESHDATAGESRRAGTAFDYGNLTFELDNGGVGVLMVSHAPYLRSALAPDVELHGSEASISIGRFTGDLHIARKPGESELLEAVPEPDAPNNFRDMVHPGLARDHGARAHRGSRIARRLAGAGIHRRRRRLGAARRLGRDG